jgi:isochorismate hydrolase
MHKPTHETWFMENLLIPDIHYVEIPEDLSDLPKKIKYFIDNSGKAKVIIKNFQEYYSKFLNIRNELLVALLVAVKYFFLSRQMSLDQLGLESFTNRFLSDK